MRVGGRARGRYGTDRAAQCRPRRSGIAAPHRRLAPRVALARRRRALAQEARATSSTPDPFGAASRSAKPDSRAQRRPPQPAQPAQQQAAPQTPRRPAAAPRRAAAGATPPAPRRASSRAPASTSLPVALAGLALLLAGLALCAAACAPRDAATETDVRGRDRGASPPRSPPSLRPGDVVLVSGRAGRGQDDVRARRARARSASRARSRARRSRSARRYEDGARAGRPPRPLSAWPPRRRGPRAARPTTSRRDAIAFVEWPEQAGRRPAADGASRARVRLEHRGGDRRRVRSMR